MSIRRCLVQLAKGGYRLDELVTETGQWIETDTQSR
jgi:hypothetical protein